MRAERAGFEPAVRVNEHTLSKRTHLSYFTEKRSPFPLTLWEHNLWAHRHFLLVLRIMESRLPNA